MITLLFPDRKNIVIFPKMSRPVLCPRNKGGRVQRNKGLPTAAKKMLVEKANKIADILGLCSGMSLEHSIGDTLYVVEHSTSASVDAATKEWMLDLTRENMKDMYMSSGWGWSDSEKGAELWHRAAQYLIIREKASKSPVAFVHFRFDMDYGHHVLYCYEVQVASAVQGAGLGAALMQLLHRVAQAASMSKVVLTVGRNNKRALKFYFGLGYRVDETSLCSLADAEAPETDCSPDDAAPREKSHTYLILSLGCKQNNESVRGVKQKR